MVLRRRVRLLAVPLLCLAAISARAATLAGVTMPDTVQLDGVPLVLNGLGLRSFTIFGIRGYVGGLYLRTRTQDAAAALAEPWPKLIHIHYLHGATARQVHDIYMDSSRIYCAAHACGAKAKADFLTLLATVRPVRPGDDTEFRMTANGTEMLFNGQPVAHLQGSEFGAIILESDLGRSPPSESLKNGMLGHSSD